jgi:flagellar biogenesis protein FliO
MMDLYLHMGAALVIVSGLILLLGYALKKRQGGDGLMKIMGYQSLGAKKGIAMVKIGSEVLLVGVTATDVKLLKSLNRPDEEREEPAQPEPAPKAITADVSDKLRKLRAMKSALRETTYAAE